MSSCKQYGNYGIGNLTNDFVHIMFCLFVCFCPLSKNRFSNCALRAGQSNQYTAKKKKSRFLSFLNLFFRKFLNFLLYKLKIRS